MTVISDVRFLWSGPTPLAKIKRQERESSIWRDCDIMADDAVDDLDATLPLAMDIQADFFEEG